MLTYFFLCRHPLTIMDKMKNTESALTGKSNNPLEIPSKEIEAKIKKSGKKDVNEERNFLVVIIVSLVQSLLLAMVQFYLKKIIPLYTPAVIFCVSAVIGVIIELISPAKYNVATFFLLTPSLSLITYIMLLHHSSTVLHTATFIYLLVCFYSIIIFFCLTEIFLRATTDKTAAKEKIVSFAFVNALSFILFLLETFTSICKKNNSVSFSAASISLSVVAYCAVSFYFISPTVKKTGGKLGALYLSFTLLMLPFSIISFGVASLFVKGTHNFVFICISILFILSFLISTLSFFVSLQKDIFIGEEYMKSLKKFLCKKRKLLQICLFMANIFLLAFGWTMLYMKKSADKDLPPCYGYPFMLLQRKTFDNRYQVLLKTLEKRNNTNPANNNISSTEAPNNPQKNPEKQVKDPSSAASSNP